MEKKMIFTGKKAVSLEEFELGAPEANQVCVRTVVSLISTGTETIAYNRAFDPGTHWDNYIKYPFTPGYSTVGRVEAVGSDVSAVARGDLVALKRPHASAHMVCEDQCMPIPESMSPEQAAWFALAKITFMGAKAAQYDLGDRVLIIGAGPIGQLSVRWARAAGAETVVAVDLVEERLKFATDGGASHVFGKTPLDCLDEIKEACGGEQPDIVMDTTGNPRAFPQALQAVRKFGTVVLLGDTGSPASQHLTPDVVLRGVTIRGAHDTHVTERWSMQNIHRLFTSLVTSGRFNVDGLTTHTFTPEECEKAFEFATEQRGSTMGILFNWNGEG